MRILGLMIFATGFLLITVDSHAQTRREGKWCHYAAGARTCNFPTLKQCNMNRRSMGGSCRRNPNYVPR
jgi:hypothetical protein